MRLKLDDLQKVVKKALDEEKATAALKQEIKRVLGPSVLTEGKLEEVAANANAWLDVLERTGRAGRLDFLSQVTSGFLDHRHPEVRRFAARVVPERYLGKMADDKDVGVRHIVASRAPMATVREMMKRFKNDDQLRIIYKERKLHEAGIPQPEAEPLGHDPVEEAEAYGDAGKTMKGPELSENWYQQQAWNMLQEYGGNIEYAWESLAVRRYCSSMKATNHVEIDETKLLKAIKDLIKEREDMAMERNALKETLNWLERQAEEQERLDETMLPELKEVDDPVRSLVESSLTSDQYIERAMTLFRIQESQLPAAIRKYRLGEGNTKVAKVPMVGWLPHGGTFRAIDERALDAFCEHWNRRQTASGEPLKIQWSTHPTDMSKVGFSVSLS